MAKQEWGTKRVCPKCGAKFYDLNKNPAECPSCHVKFDVELQAAKKTKRKPVRAAESQKSLKPAIAAQKKKSKKAEGDEQGGGLPEFEDMGIIEDMDDLEVLEEVEVSSKSAVEEDAEDEEAFMEDDALIEEQGEEDEEEDDK